MTSSACYRIRDHGHGLKHASCDKRVTAWRKLRVPEGVLRECVLIASIKPNIDRGAALSRLVDFKQIEAAISATQLLAPSLSPCLRIL